MTQHAQLFASAETLALESVDWFEDRVFVFFPPPQVETLPVVFHRITSAPGSTTRRLIDSLTSELFTARFVSPPNRDIYIRGDSEWRSKVNGELRRPLSITNTRRQRHNHRSASSRVERCSPWVHIVCSTWRRGAEPRVPVSSSLALRSVTLSCARRKDERVDYFTKHNCRRVSDNLCYFFLRNCEFARCAHFFFSQPSVWSGALMLGVRTIWKGTLW